MFLEYERTSNWTSGPSPVLNFFGRKMRSPLLAFTAFATSLNHTWGPMDIDHRSSKSDITQLQVIECFEILVTMCCTNHDWNC